MPEIDICAESDSEMRLTGAKYDPAIRRPVAVRLPFGPDDVCLPHPCLSDPQTTQAGVLKRFLRPTPKPVERGPISLSGLIRYAKKWVKRLKPLDNDADLSVEHWLSKTSYPQFRKDELLRKWDDCNRTLKRKHFSVKSFVKDEFYPEYKHARAINSRTDQFKCAFGPWIRAIEEIVYDQPEFIKHIPVIDRPKYIEERLGAEGAKYFWADFTAFESHFKPEILERIEFILYRYMAQHHPRRHELEKLLSVISGHNVCSFKHFTVECEGRRMSGEMNTSLGNGFVNLMLINYLFECYNEKNVTVVEGDDSNTRFFHHCPTTEDFAALGFTVKCGVVNKLEEMSFCGLVYTVEDRINVPDPYKAVAAFNWARSAYWKDRNSRLITLLRVKALSYAHQYPGAPVVQEMAHSALRLTRSYDAKSFVARDRHMDDWTRSRFLSFPKVVPYVPTPMSTRMLCERIYGMTIEEQLRVENEFKQTTTLKPHHSTMEFPVLWKEYYARYSANIRDFKMAEVPCFPPTLAVGFEAEFVPIIADYRNRS